MGPIGGRHNDMSTSNRSKLKWRKGRRGPFSALGMSGPAWWGFELYIGCSVAI